MTCSKVSRRGSNARGGTPNQAAESEHFRLGPLREALQLEVLQLLVEMEQAVEQLEVVLPLRHQLVARADDEPGLHS